VSEINRIHIHAPCVNWSAGISYPHSRACPLIGSFLLGFTYCDETERESDKNIIFRCSFIGYFFPGFHIVVSGNVFLCLTMIQKRTNIKTLGNLINTRGLRPLVQIRYPRVSMLFLLLIFGLFIFYWVLCHTDTVKVIGDVPALLVEENRRSPSVNYFRHEQEPE
jgi:hypothetical protein